MDCTLCRWHCRENGHGLRKPVFFAVPSHPDRDELPESCLQGVGSTADSGGSYALASVRRILVVVLFFDVTAGGVLFVYGSGEHRPGDPAWHANGRSRYRNGHSRMHISKRKL